MGLGRDHAFDIIACPPDATFTDAQTGVRSATMTHSGSGSGGRHRQHRLRFPHYALLRLKLLLLMLLLPLFSSLLVLQSGVFLELFPMLMMMERLVGLLPLLHPLLQVHCGWEVRLGRSHQRVHHAPFPGFAEDGPVAAGRGGSVGVEVVVFGQRLARLAHQVLGLYGPHHQLRHGARDDVLHRGRLGKVRSPVEGVSEPAPLVHGEPA